MMMDAVAFLKEKERMCKKTGFCADCPVYKKNSGYDVTCEEFMNEHPKEYVSCVEKWSAEHPVKTRQSEFLKMFPDARMTELGSLKICPADADRSISCSGESCMNCQKGYWLAEID